MSKFISTTVACAAMMLMFSTSSANAGHHHGCCCCPCVPAVQATNTPAEVTPLPNQVAPPPPQGVTERSESVEPPVAPQSGSTVRSYSYQQSRPRHPFDPVQRRQHPTSKFLW